MLTKFAEFLSLFKKGQMPQGCRHAQYEEHIRALEGRIVDLQRNYFKIHKFLNGICKEDRQDFLTTRFALGDEEHQRNVALLCQNLSEEALAHLKNILEKKDKLYRSGFVALHDFFSEDELHELDEVRKFHKESRFVSTPEGGYWKWGHYKLPGRMKAIDSRTSIFPMRFFVSVFFHKHGVDTLKTIDAIGDKAIIDAGAWVGDSALIFREKFPNSRIYCFEPNLEYYELAKETMMLNAVDNVTLENIGLGETNKRVTMSGMAVSPNGDKTVVLEALDNYVQKYNLKVGLIKTDLEGYEPLFLEGAMTTIREQKPVLVISIYHSYNDFYKIKPLIESWNLGYKFDFFKGIDEGMGEIMLLAEVY